MDDPKQKIKEWLKSIKKDRLWLAEQCFVKKKQVDNWLSSSIPLPAAKLSLIKSLMEKSALDMGKTSGEGMGEDATNGKVYMIRVELNEEEEARLDRHAQERGLRLEKYTKQEDRL